MLPKSVEDLANHLNITPDDLVEIAITANQRYRHHRIPKRSGGERQIAEPDQVLKVIQRRLLEQVLVTVPLHPAATAFHHGASVQANAAAHSGHRFVFSTDLGGFFPSITQPRVVGLFAALGMPDEVAQLLGKLMCYRGRLAQGAPTSPAIANLIARKLDQRLTGYCERRNWCYTRYADDLTISGNGRWGDRDREWVARCLAGEGFEMNQAKTRLARRQDAQVVTGLSVNRGCRLPRHHRQRLRAMFHQAAQDPAAFTARVEELRGHLTWLRAIEPDNLNIPSYEAVLDRVAAAANRSAPAHQ